MLKNRVLEFAFGLICISFCTFSFAEDTLTFINPIYPPYHFKEKGRIGIADKIEAILKKELKGYKFLSQEATPARVMENLKNGKHIVAVTLLKDAEREKYIEFSDLTTVKPSNELTIRIEDLSKYQGMISLDKLFENKDFTLGVARARLYGPGIDPALKKYKDRLIVRSSSDDIKGLLQMLLLKRMHAIIGYPHSTFMVAKELGVEKQFATLPIKGQPALTLSYTGAPKNEWGKEVIKKINAIYKKYNIVKLSSEELEPYLDPGVRARFRSEWPKLVK